jgi:hypothetical protein
MGFPARNSFLEEGFDKGDPLSPLLFVEWAELLQDMINDLNESGKLIAPEGQDFPIV